MVKVGDTVRANILKYQGFRGKVVGIESGMAKIEIPTYYGNKEPAIIYQDIRYTYPIPETLQELEKLKNKLRGGK